MSQWNPRRSRGASGKFRGGYGFIPRLSGTPAEAGVRDGAEKINADPRLVSVEPPPKQGCEASSSSWPSRIARVSVEPPPKQGCETSCFLFAVSAAMMSQWNPRRSRGARSPPEHIDIACRIGAFIHPPAILFDFCDFKEHLCDSTSNSYCLSSGSTSIHPPIRFFVAHRVFHSARKFLLATFAG